MFWKTTQDNGDLQWQTFLAGWLFVSFLVHLVGSLLRFLQMLLTLCLGRPCLSWNLRETFHGALGNLEDQNVAWADTTEYKGGTLDFVPQVHDFSIAALHLERYWSAFVTFGRYSWPFSRRTLAFPSRTCLHLTNSRSFAMDILLSFCLS